MDSSANTKQADPRDVSPGLSTQDIELVARADERLAHAYQQIASADEQLGGQCTDFQDGVRFRAEEGRQQASSAIAWQAGAARLHRPAVDSGHRFRCFRFAVLWRDGQADDLPVGAATGFVVAVGNTGTRRPAKPATCSGGCGGHSNFAIITSGSDPATRRGTRPDPTRGDTVAPNDGARSRKRAAGDRAAQGQPARIGPRKCWDRRTAQGEPGTNGARDLQRLRAEPAEDIGSDISQSATAGCQPCA